MYIILLQDLSKGAYNPPKHGARELAALLGENKSARVLDCGAGTGLGGVEVSVIFLNPSNV